MPIGNFGWQDSPSAATPLDAANLEAFGQFVGAYVDTRTPASVVTDASATPKDLDSTGAVGVANTANQGLVYDPGSGLFKPKRVMLNEPTSSNMTYTVYLDVAFGNDANDGQTLGTGVRTLTQAVALLQQAGAGTAGHGGRVHIVSGANAGNIDCAAPISIVQAITISGLSPSSSTIRRTFGTPNGRSVWDAVVTAGGGTVVSATVAFTNSDASRIVSIYGAGTGGGTYYDFINGNPPNGTTANLTATTTVARNSTTDPKGVKLSVVGDWNRVVTDASITTPGAGVNSVITSATAAWTLADIGTQVVIAQAGQGGQALRGAIKAISGNTATITATATTAVANKRCAIGVNFGDLLTFHAGQGGLENVILTDQTGNTAIGSAITILADDGAATSQLSPSDMAFTETTVTSTNASGAWEHIVTCDGSWNQNTGGPGVRRVAWVGCKFFGARRPTETLRLICPIHWSFAATHTFDAAPTAIAQGTIILDPQSTAGVQTSAVDVNFGGCEGAYFYCEGQRVNYHGRLSTHGVAVGGRVSVELGKTSQWCGIYIADSSPGPTIAIDNGVSNTIVSNLNRRQLTREALVKKQRGILTETWDLILGRDYPTNAAVTGTIWVALVGLIGGDVVTGLACDCQTSAGSGLTIVKMGVWNATGTLLGSTADFHLTLATGLNSNNLTSPLTVASDGGYFIGLVAIGTTGPSLTRSGGTSAVSGIAINGGTPQTVQFGAVTDIQNISGFSAGGGIGFWFAAY